MVLRGPTCTKYPPPPIHCTTSISSQNLGYKTGWMPPFPVKECSPTSSMFQVLCIQRFYPAFLGCLFKVLLLFDHLEPVCPFSRRLTSTKHSWTCNWIFSLFWTVLCKPFEIFCVELPSKSVVSKILRPARRAQTAKVT